MVPQVNVLSAHFWLTDTELPLANLQDAWNILVKTARFNSLLLEEKLLPASRTTRNLQLTDTQATWSALQPNFSARPTMRPAPTTALERVNALKANVCADLEEPARTVLN